MDQEPEEDEGYVELVYAKEDENGTLTESPVRTNLWAWKHPPQGRRDRYLPEAGRRRGL